MNGFVGDWSLSNDAVSRVEWLFQENLQCVSRVNRDNDFLSCWL